MNFAEMLNAIHSFHPSIHTLTDADIMLYGAFPVTSDKGKLSVEPNMLYIVQSEHLANRFVFNKDNTLLNVLVLGKVDEMPEDLSLKRINMIYVNDDSQAEEISDTLIRRMSVDMQVHDTMRVLTEALFANRGNQYILDCGWNVLKNPIIEMGRTDNRLLMSYGDEDVQNGSIFKKIMNDLQSDNPALRDKVVNSYLIDSDLLTQLRNCGHDLPIHHYNKALGKDQMTILIRIRGIEVGCLTIVAQSHPFADFDEEIFYRLSILIAQELQKKSLYTKNRNEVKAQFLNRLLTSQEITSDYLYHMLKMRNIVDIKDKFYLAVISGSDTSRDLDPNDFDMITEQLRSILTNSFYLVRDTELVILFNLAEKADIHSFDDTLIAHVVSSGFVVGISNMYRNLSDTAKHYRQARKAVEVGAEYKDHTINYFSVIAPMEAIRVIGRHEDLTEFIVPELFDLLQMDKENNSDLVTTLYAYLENFGNTARSAQQLFIHKNTLLYRIGKIKEVLHCNLEDGEDIFKLMLSLRIMRSLSLYILPDELANRDKEDVDFY